MSIYIVPLWCIFNKVIIVAVIWAALFLSNLLLESRQSVGDCKPPPRDPNRNADRSQHLAEVFCGAPFICKQNTSWWKKPQTYTRTGSAATPVTPAGPSLGSKSCILPPTNRGVVQPVTWRDQPITAVIQLLFKLGGRIPDLGQV